MSEDLMIINAPLKEVLENVITSVMLDDVSREDAEWIATQIIGNRFMGCYQLYKDRLIQNLRPHGLEVEP